MNLNIIARTGHINRWQIIRTQRNQTIAEHMYQVTLICMEIFACLNKDNISRDDQKEIEIRLIKAALIHDIPEVESGDLPTPFKKSIKSVLGDYFEERFWNGPLIYRDEYRRGIPGPRHTTSLPSSRLDGYVYSDLIEIIISLADNVEALAFILTERVGKRGRTIWMGLKGNIEDLIEKAKNEISYIDSWDDLLEIIMYNIETMN